MDVSKFKDLNPLEKFIDKTVNIIVNLGFFLLIWGLTTRQPLWVILYRLPEKREKRDGRDIRGDESEGQGRKRNGNESEETEEIKTFPLHPYLLKDSRPCPTVSPYLFDSLVRKIYDTFATPDHPQF